MKALLIEVLLTEVLYTKSAFTRITPKQGPKFRHQVHSINIKINKILGININIKNICMLWRITA